VLYQLVLMAAMVEIVVSVIVRSNVLGLRMLLFKRIHGASELTINLSGSWCHVFRER
jgi:hypothetical protein